MPISLTLAPAAVAPPFVKADDTTLVLVPLVAHLTNPKIVAVDFYRLSPTLTLLGTVTKPPWTLVCSVLLTGPRVIFAIGRDATGAALESSPPITVPITVAVPPPPPLPPPIIILPVPPPAAGTFATPQIGIGWASFPLVLPQGWTASDLKVGPYPSQTDVMVLWDDGTIREAQVTTKVDTAGQYPIRAGSRIAGSFTPIWPTASVAFSTGGLTYTATLPTFTNRDTFYNGPLMKESRAVVTPVSLMGPHPLLQVVFDVRAFVDGGCRVDACVQNVKDVADGGPVTYDVTLTVDGVVRFAKTGAVHSYFTRGRLPRVLTGGLVEADVAQDFEPFYLAGALPRFLPDIVSPKPTLGPQFDFLGFANLSLDMGAPGGREEIAPVHNKYAQFLVHKLAELRAYMLATADCSGSYRGHFTEPDGQTLISLDTYPRFWLDGAAETGHTPRVGLEAARVQYQGSSWPGGWSWPIETAHHPSLCYVPYLVTGDRYYLDQMKFWANYCLLDTGGDLFQTQTRGIGWSIRDLADVAAYCPDADPMRGYFTRRLQENLNRLDNYARAYDGGPMEILFPLKGNDDVMVTSLWANSYVAWALDHAEAQGFGPVAEMRDRIVRTQARFFSSEPDYPRTGGAPYYPVVGASYFSGVCFDTMKQVFDATRVSYTKSFAADWERYAFPPFAGYYGPEARLMLQIGVREKVPGAQAALDYLEPFIVGDLEYRSGWAIQA